MLSLKKSDSDEEVEAFIASCGRDETYCVEPKVDGVSVVFRYRDGQLVQALTRGDGHTGKDVTAQIMAAGCVPMLLTNAPVVLEVRGEVFMPFAVFDAMNARRMENGNEPLKSPRNSTAGTLRMKDLPEVAERGLACRIFAVVDADPKPSSHIHGLAWLSGWGLPAIPCRAVPGSKVLEAIGAMNGQRAGLPYPTDGIVVRLDERSAYERMGSTARWPNGALARKYKPVSVESRLLAVEWTKGENGRLTPVACFEPVEVDGASLQRACLGSLEHLRALDLMIGDRIQVIRAGGSIPVILGRCPGSSTGEEKPIPDPVQYNFFLERRG